VQKAAGGGRKEGQGQNPGCKEGTEQHPIEIEGFWEQRREEGMEEMNADGWRPSAGSNNGQSHPQIETVEKTKRNGEEEWRGEETAKRKTNGERRPSQGGGGKGSK
jgi:hypothetical protein